MTDAAPTIVGDSSGGSMADSAATWDEERSRSAAVGEETRRVPPELIPPRSGPTRARLRAWRQRHLLREQRARDYYDRSRNPDRGLPVAGRSAVTDFVRDLIVRRKGLVTVMLILNGIAAVAALVVPKLLGRLVDVTAKSGTVAATVNGLAMAVVGVVLLQAVFTFGARCASAVLGQDLLASAREHIVRTVLRLPLSKIESASSGDLVTRITRDVSTMSESVRFGLPEAVIASVTTVLTVAAMIVNSWFLALPVIASAVPLWISVRRYFRRAPMGYITEGGTYSQINTTLTESVEGARTSEALRLEERRVGRTDGDVAESAQAERYTITLRNLLFGVIDTAYNSPLAWTLLLGGLGYAQGWVTLGQITAATLYIQSVMEPLDRLISNVDRLQVGVASTTRLLGIADVPADRRPGDDRPADTHLTGRDLRFAYREGHDVLHGVDLDLIPGERLAIVGPSGSGKSTLGRLMAGINGPRAGRVQVGGVDLVKLPLDQLRTQVSLVTQEHHVFVGTVRDNIVLAREDSGDDVVIDALRAVDAWDWVRRLPDGLDTMIGSGQNATTPAQAQQIALARLVVADPHTLVLDEATSLIDPHTARHLEGSMASLLHGRTVVAIAHRLHTAHDADRIAVVIDGTIAELGSHDELLAAEGEYAALWRAWTS